MLVKKKIESSLWLSDLGVHLSEQKVYDLERDFGLRPPIHSKSLEYAIAENWLQVISSSAAGLDILKKLEKLSQQDVIVQTSEPEVLEELVVPPEIETSSQNTPSDAPPEVPPPGEVADIEDDLTALITKEEERWMQDAKESTTAVPGEEEGVVQTKNITPIKGGRLSSEELEVLKKVTPIFSMTDAPKVIESLVALKKSSHYLRISGVLYSVEEKGLNRESVLEAIMS